MGITLNIWVFSGIIGIAYFGGYLMAKWMMSQPVVEAVAESAEQPQPEPVKSAPQTGQTGVYQGRRLRGRHHERQGEAGIRKYAGRAVGSPVTGLAETLPEEKGKGILIHPENGRIYSPAAGKIIKLYPGGNEFMIRTEFGAYLHLKVGERDEDMIEDYYRARVIQNEIVGKGKLLMEFDLEGLEQDGYRTDVVLRVEDYNVYREINAAGDRHIRGGEDCLWLLK